MGTLGKEIYRERDEQGWICVHEDGVRRYLTFGNQVEQSCMLLADPLRLEHVHTQAMMLGTLFAPPPEAATLLGLGGGSLAKCLLHLYPRCRIRAVEQRARVVAVARDYFSLPHAPRLRVVIADAGDYLASPRRPSDLMFADLYRADAMDAQQTAPEFLCACRAGLSSQGVLVTNLWHRDPKQTAAAQGAIADAFDGRLLQLDVQSGNRVVYAFAEHLPRPRRQGLFEQAHRLGRALGIPAQRLARDLWFQNAPTLRLGRPMGGETAAR
jgi:spermidine synthase